MLKLIFLLVAGIQAANGLICVECKHFTINTGYAQLDDLYDVMTDRLDTSDCADHPELVINTTDCLTCRTMFANFNMTINLFDFLLTAEFDLVLRGCGDEKKTEDECETNSEVLEDVILNDEVNETNSEDYDMMSDVSGGQCTCTEELCNTHTIEEVIPGLGPLCYVCESVRADNQTVGDAIRYFSGSQNSRCHRSDLSGITPTRCQEDEVCYSMKVDVSEVDGDAVLEAEVWYRGCIHQDVVEGLQEEECVSLFYHPEVLDAVVPLELEVSIGGVCTCHDDKCNVHSDSDIDKVTRIARCISCSHVDTAAKKSKFDKIHPGQESEECRSDPRSINPETCPAPGQMCVSMTMDLKAYKGLHHRIRVLRRGCVDIIANVTTGCHDAMDYHDVAGDLLGTDDYEALYGGICFCDKDGCNDDSMERLRAYSGVEMCVISCEGLGDGVYNRCDTCSGYYVCSKGKKKEKKCRGRKREFDGDQKKCVKRSNTCQPPLI